MKKSALASIATSFVVILAAACSTSTLPTTGTCVDRPTDTTCLGTDGHCSDLACVDGAWGCLTGESEVAASSCPTHDVDAGEDVVVASEDAATPTCAAIGGSCGAVGACGVGAGHLGPQTTDCSSAEDVCCIPEDACSGPESVQCCTAVGGQERPQCASATSTSFTCLAGSSICVGDAGTGG